MDEWVIQTLYQLYGDTMGFCWVSAGEPHPVSQEESLLALNPVALSGRSAVGLKLLQRRSFWRLPLQKLSSKKMRSALENDGSEMRGMMAYGDF